MHSDCFAFAFAAFGNEVDGVKSPTCRDLIVQMGSPCCFEGEG